jgi:NTP pyrophosphatase (non-canonical NTP hydrolase)
MTLEEYEEQANETAQYPGRLGMKRDDIMGLMYTSLGLAGEAGEYADKIKKVLRDDNSNIKCREPLLYELGDVLWYVTQNAQELGFSLKEVAQMNIEKLRSRKSRRKIGGSGDNR